jgi:hypothetical protein
MKKLFSFIYIFFCSSLLFSQTDCDNNVSTDYQNPTNDYLPRNLLTDNDIRFLNRTNFYPLTPAGELEDFDLTNMIWSGTTLLEMDNIWSDQTLPYYNYISKTPIPVSKNGWELLLINLGRYPDDVTEVTNNESFQAIPYIVIYNRYSGVVRVFANFGLDNVPPIGADAVEIILAFKNPQTPNVNGLARLYQGQDQALNDSTKIKTMKAIAKATNSARQWFSADFQVAYDPCTCYNPSQLQLSFNQIKSESIELHGRSLSVDDDIINNSLQVNTFNFFSSFDYQGNDTEKGGILIYKGLQNLVDDYITRYNDYLIDSANVQFHNEIVENNLGALKMLKYMLTAVLTFGANPSAIDIGPAQLTDWYPKMNEIYGDFIKKADSTFDIDKILEIGKKVLGSNAKTFIEQDFEKLPTPSAPTPTPSITFSEMHFKGQILDQSPKGGPTFYTPGTYGTKATKIIVENDTIDPIISSMYSYPVYNDVLGTFALLNTPKLILSERPVPGTSTTLSKTITLSNGVTTPITYKSWTREFQFKLSEDIKYALNTVLDIEKHNVKAQLRFKSKNKYIFTNGQEFNTFIDPNYTTNVVSTNQNVNAFDPLRSYSGTPFTNNVYNGWGPFLPSGSSTYPDDTAIFETPFIPLNSFYNFIPSVGLKQEFFSLTGDYISELNGVTLDFFDVELVLMIDIQYQTINTSNNKNTTVQILSFKIPSSNISKISTSLAPNLFQQLDMTPYNENLEFGTTLFNGSQVRGCKLSGSLYTCQAWNDITISGNLSTSNGYSVNIKAGNSITTIDEGSISPEIILSIIPVLDYSHPMYQSNSTYVDSFCRNKNPQGQNYMGNLVNINKTVQDSTNVSQNGTSSQNEQDSILAKSDFDFQLYPNPSSQLTRVVVEGNESGLATLSVFDVMGKEQNLIIQGQNGQFNFDVSPLAKGMYFVRLNTIGASKTKQLIVK